MKKYFETFKSFGYWISIGLIALAYISFMCIVFFAKAVWFNVLLHLWLLLFVFIPLAWISVAIETVIERRRQNKQ